MAYFSYSTSINCNASFYSIRHFNEEAFGDKFTLSDLDLKLLLRQVFEMKYRGVVKLLSIEQEKEIHRDERKLGEGKILSLFQDVLLVGLK